MTKKILSLALLLVLSFSLQVNGQTPPAAESPEALGRAFFAALQEGDKEKARSFVISEADYAAIESGEVPVENLKKASRDIKKEVEDAAIEFEKDWQEFTRWLEKKEVDLSQAVIKEVKVDDLKSTTVGSKCDVEVIFTVAGKDYELELDDVIRVGRGWVLSEDGFEMD